MDDRVALTLFRHGVTDDNRRRAYIGWTNSPLSEDATFAPVDPDCYDLIFSSDLERCIQTAKHLFPSRKVTTMPFFRELFFGEWEGKTYSDLEHDQHYRSWIADPFTITPPDGESFQSFTNRIEEGFKVVVDQVMRTPNRKACIVTHGGVIRYLLATYAPEQRAFWEWRISHGTGVELEWKSDDLRSEKRCISLRVVPLTANPNG